MFPEAIKRNRVLLGGEGMKAFISTDTLRKIIQEHTILCKDGTFEGKKVPEIFQWFQTSDGIVTWDFISQDKILVEVENESNT